MLTRHYSNVTPEDFGHAPWRLSSTDNESKPELAYHLVEVLREEGWTLAEVTRGIWQMLKQTQGMTGMFPGQNSLQFIHTFATEESFYRSVRKFLHGKSDFYSDNFTLMVRIFLYWYEVEGLERWEAGCVPGYRGRVYLTQWCEPKGTFN